MGDKMINRYRLKIFYKENKVTIDVDENITFNKLSEIINDRLLLNRCKFYEFLHNNIVIAAENKKEDVKIKDYLELDQKLIYHTGKKTDPCNIEIIVWDYILDANDAVMKKFVQLVKKVDKAKPKQIYYLSKEQRRFIDNILKDCYESLKTLNFGGEYHYHLLKNGKNYLAVKLTYYMLDDKYELCLFNTVKELENGTYKFLISFYDMNRAYFKGYQGVNRNIFVLSGKDDTIRSEDFEYIYNALNRLMYMFKDVDGGYLFANHDKYLIYDIADGRYRIKK